MMTPEEKLDALLGRLEEIIKLIALQTISGKKVGDAAVILERAGLDRRIIADVLGTSQSSVRALISRSQSPSNKKAKPVRKG
jgi:hypothetical protein